MSDKHWDPPTPKRVIQGAVRAYLTQFGQSELAQIADGIGMTQNQCRSACKALGCDSQKYGGWSYSTSHWGRAPKIRIPVLEYWYLPEQATRRPVLCRRVA